MRAIKGLLGATAIAVALLTSGCSSGQSLNLFGTAQSTPTASASPSASTPATSSPSPTPTPTSGGMTSGTTQVAGSNGKRQSMPSLSGAQIPNGNTSNLREMPPLSGALALDCGTLQGWDTLVPCIDKSGAAGQQYKDQVNKMHTEGTLAFDWPTVQKWGSAKTIAGNLPEARVIEVFGYTEAEMPVDKARANIADLVGGTDVAKGLTVVYKPASFIDTLRPLYQNQGMSIEQFVDFNKQVRASLAPLVLDDKGAVIGVDTHSDSGVFVDCYNIHGMAAFMPAAPGAELVCQEGTSLAGKPLPESGECNLPPPSACTTCECAGNCNTGQCTTCECAGNCVPQCTTCECAGNCGPKCTTCTCLNNCLTQKGDSVANGWTPLGSGALTNGQNSRAQQQSGQVSGNVTDSKVPAGTTSGSTTPDLPKGSTTASGATAGGDSSTGVPRDTSNTTTGGTTGSTGGTSGATCITDPDTGTTTCK